MTFLNTDHEMNFGIKCSLLISFLLKKKCFCRDFEYYFFSSYTFFNRNTLVVLLFLITPIF